MENVVIVRAPSAEAAQALLRDLARCSGERGFKLEAGTVVYRDAGGRVANANGVSEAWAPATTAGATTGALLGLLSGPLAVLLGGAAGAAVGRLVDRSGDDDADAIVDAVARSVPPDSHNVLAVAVEPSPTVVDDLAAAHGGSVVRYRRGELECELAAAEEAIVAARREARRVLRRRRQSASPDERRRPARAIEKPAGVVRPG